MPAKFKAPRGTQDILPSESWRWQQLEAAFRDVCRRYGYREIRTPLFEETELFARGAGETTELVGKQMYTFTDKGGRSLTLRAEGTAPVVRAYVEHSLGRAGLQKLYYIAPIFRYERPQAGRYRQHYQLGVEAIGAAGPDIDAEVIALYLDFQREINLSGGVVHLSSIGDAQCRPAFSGALREFFKDKIADMCEFCQTRYETNPLRILDCKVPPDVEARQGAPNALDYLCDECREHFAGVRAQLDALGIEYEVDPTIVRGLDYYTRTAFEVIHPSLGAKDVIMGGGRYDGLVELLGGSPTPGIGFGAGIERLLLSLEAGESAEVAPGLDVYVAAASEEARLPALQLAEEIRRAGLAVDLDYQRRSLRAQMREAARVGARYTALLGEDELTAGTVTLRDMGSGEQESVPRGEVVDRLVAEWAGEDA
jgi:histidyl-tRNA synthetase